MTLLSSYYHATIAKQHHLFVVGVLKYFDHLCFDRTLDAQKGLFEFFVPADQEAEFLNIMNALQEKGFIQKLIKTTNRLAE